MNKWDSSSDWHILALGEVWGLRTQDWEPFMPYKNWNFHFLMGCPQPFFTFFSQMFASCFPNEHPFCLSQPLKASFVGSVLPFFPYMIKMSGYFDGKRPATIWQDDQRVTCTSHMNYVLLFRQWSISCLDSFTYLGVGMDFSRFILASWPSL